MKRGSNDRQLVSTNIWLCPPPPGDILLVYMQLNVSYLNSSCFISLYWKLNWTVMYAHVVK